MIGGQHYDIVSVRVAQGMGVFDAFAASEGNELTVAELLSKTKGDEQLLGMWQIRQFENHHCQ